MTLATGSSTKDATTLALSLWACPSRPSGVSGSTKPRMFFSGKILKEYSPVVYQESRGPWTQSGGRQPTGCHRPAGVMAGLCHCPLLLFPLPEPPPLIYWLPFGLQICLGFASPGNFLDSVGWGRGLPRGGWTASWRRWRLGRGLKEEQVAHRGKGMCGGSGLGC